MSDNNKQSVINAVKISDIEAVRKLLDLGSDIHEIDDDGWTPLNHAAGKGDYNMVLLLLERGAEVFRTGRDQRTPYKIAIAAAHVEVAKLLAKREAELGGDTERISSEGWRDRRYCKAYRLGDLRKFDSWMENKAGASTRSDDDIVFVHQDLAVTSSMWRDQDIIFDNITEDWSVFCKEQMAFRVPDDFALVPN